VLIEVGYISHPQEGTQLGRAEYQEKLVTAIAEGVKTFLGEVRKRDAPKAEEAPEEQAEGEPVARPASL
jgi:N-acetylmuramoyl-L-alanine amidase